jgi:uncharacterized membrane protein
MKSILALLFLFLTVITSSAQIDIPKTKIRLTTISLIEGDNTLVGIIYKLKDSSLVLLRTESLQNYSLKTDERIQLDVDVMDKVSIGGTRQVLRGAVIGAVSGLFVGSAIGYLSGDDPPCESTGWGNLFCWRNTAEDKALYGGLIGIGAGAAIGALIGSISVKIPINGKMNNYSKNRDKLMVYSMVKS